MKAKDIFVNIIMMIIIFGLATAAAIGGYFSVKTLNTFLILLGMVLFLVAIFLYLMVIVAIRDTFKIQLNTEIDRFEDNAIVHFFFGTTTRVAITIGVVIILIFVIFSWTRGEKSTSTTETVKCQVCYQSYKKGSDNARSIARSNMCTQCHDNFEWRQEVQDYIDNQPQ